MDAHPTGRKAAPRRRGILSAELLLVLPIFMTLMLAMLEFSMALLARQQLLAASREGARVASLGGDPAAVELAVRRSLGNGRLGGAEVEVQGTAADGQPVLSGDPVGVVVRVPAAQAAPDLLRFVGYSLSGREVAARTVMRKE